MSNVQFDLGFVTMAGVVWALFVMSGLLAGILVGRVCSVVDSNSNKEPEQHARIRICYGQIHLLLGAICFGIVLSTLTSKSAQLTIGGVLRVAECTLAALVVIFIAWFVIIEYVVVNIVMRLEPSPPPGRIPRLVFITGLSIILSIIGFISGCLLNGIWFAEFKISDILDVAKILSLPVIAAAFGWFFRDVEFFPLPRWASPWFRSNNPAGP